MNEFGSSTITIYIEAKIGKKKWYINTMGEKTGIDLIEWIKKVQDFNCGEILLINRF